MQETGIRVEFARGEIANSVAVGILYEPLKDHLGNYVFMGEGVAVVFDLYRGRCDEWPTRRIVYNHIFKARVRSGMMAQKLDFPTKSKPTDSPWPISKVQKSNLHTVSYREFRNRKFGGSIS